MKAGQIIVQTEQKPKVWKIKKTEMKLDIEEVKLILVQESFTHIIRALNNFDIACFDKYGNNVLHYYVKNNESIDVPPERMIQLLIDLGIDINAKQTKSPERTALQLALMKKSKLIFDILLKKGVDVNIKDVNGNVPLLDAVMSYKGDDGYFIKALISNGARVDIKNNYGVTPKGLSDDIANYNSQEFFK
jgi:ankyrin repeat protein